MLLLGYGLISYSSVNFIVCLFTSINFVWRTNVLPVFYLKLMSTFHFIFKHQIYAFVVRVVQTNLVASKVVFIFIIIFVIIIQIKISTILYHKFKQNFIVFTQVSNSNSDTSNLSQCLFQIKWVYFRVILKTG